MQIDASPIADVIAGGATSFCEGGSVLLGTALDPDYTYLWITGETTNTITVDSTHNYGVAVISTSTGCIAFDSLEVTVFPLPNIDAGLDTSVALGLSTMLNGTGGLTYLWSPTTGLDNPFIANPSASPSSTTTYTLTATDNNGCTNSDSVVVTVTGDVVLTIYTIITPNGDGFNDTWIIDNLISYPNNSVAIYNRYGQVVYEATNYANDWDGTREGDQLPEGAYFYVVELTDSGEVFKGTVNIVRSSN
jgi:gliding motility-associated-like protein